MSKKDFLKILPSEEFVEKLKLLVVEKFRKLNHFENEAIEKNIKVSKKVIVNKSASI